MRTSRSDWRGACRWDMSVCGRREEWDDGNALAEVTRRGKESCQMQEEGDIYMKNAAGEGRSGPFAPQSHDQDDQAGGDRSEIGPTHLALNV